MSTSLPPTKPPAEVHPMQALLDQGGYDMPQRGDIREGTVISVSPQEVVIDLGLKREAIVPANDLSRLDKATLAEVQEGTTWPVYILIALTTATGHYVRENFPEEPRRATIPA